LIYVAGDYKAYGGTIKDEEPYFYYIKNLKEWTESPFATPKLKSIYVYLSKGRLVRDLIDSKILLTDTNGRLVEQWKDEHKDLFESKPPLYSHVNESIGNAFVRFNVYSPHKTLKKIWQDPEMYDSFVRFYNQRSGEKDFCYVTGEYLPVTDKHASRIRNPADKAKLISANDSSGFTYRGRFQNSREAASISYDVSQKAHNALKWLINRQGKIVDGRVFLVWANEDTEIPDLNDDLFEIAPETAEVKDLNVVPYTGDLFAREIAKAMDGYRARLSSLTNVNIIILDSATTGRMAVLYYRNMDKELYLDRLVKWHSTCIWLHRYRKNDNGEFIQFFGAPATRDIAFAAYGSSADGKLVKGLMERMLPCILDGRKIPQDIVNSAFYRASNPVSMDRWEWEKTLSIACALIRKQREREGLQVALDEKNNDRDYLFGRLLAVADVLERNAMGSEETRATNAIRYMNAFSKHPARTWKTIQECLQPYQARMGTRATYYSKIIDEVGSRIPANQFNNKPLSGLYLLGFYSQRHELYQKKSKQEELHDTPSNL
jgi:CRISPR-associated protein Csd1